MYDDVMTRNEGGELAVRTVSATEGSNTSSYDDVFTRTTDGKLAMRVTGSGGGGDSHNKGYFATLAELQEAYPTGEAGDWAIVAESDTVYIWDDTQQAWVDTDQKGQVTSVNNQTGDVTLTASDVGALPDNTHIPADPVQADWDESDNTALDYIKNKPTIPAAQVNSDWNANSGVAQILNKPTIPDVVQYSTMPTASADNLGDIVQFIGTTDANYTNGYFYKCVSDGQDPATYSWTRVDVQPAGATYTAGNGISIDANNEISAIAPVAYESAITGSPEVQKGSSATRVGLLAIGNSAVAGGRQSTAGDQCLAIGDRANAGNYQGHNAIAVGMGTENYQTMADQYSVAIGNGTRSLNCGVALGHGLMSGQGGIIIGYNFPSSSQMRGGDQCFDVVLFNTRTYVANQYRILDANGKIPVERINDSAVVKYSSMPTGSPDISGMIAQYVGETDSTYTNGYFYRCSGVITAPSSVEVDTVSTNVDPTLVSVDISTLESWMVAHNKSIDYDATIYLYCFGSKWLITISGVQSGQVYLSDCGVTYSGDAQSGDIIYLNYTAATKEYSWVQTNVQPSGLPSTTGLADGNYRLRLVMASGVPTLEWVAE